MDSVDMAPEPKFPLKDASIVNAFSQKEHCSQSLLSYLNLINLLAMQETYAMAERVRLSWLISYFKIDRGAIFVLDEKKTVLSLGLDRNGKILEKFSFDKKALNRSQKQKVAQLPLTTDISSNGKRAWVLPFPLEEPTKFLYMDCLSGTDSKVCSEELTAFFYLSENYFLHCHFPDLEKEKVPLTERKQFKFSYSKIIGKSPAMCRVFETLDKVSGADHLPVLILGKSGTGKELIAQVIHDNSPRIGKPYIAENCAAVTETLLESELFGYVAGAFTGAERTKKGLFDAAHTGTLFLDEVGDMSLEMQKKLLRVLQEGEIRPVGAQTTHHVDVRIVAATNRDLKTMIRDGLFREDLYFRLSALVIYLPELCKRGKDVEDLLDFFLEKTTRDLGQAKRHFDPELKNILVEYPWPGNVRELENEVKRMVALGEQVLTTEVLSTQIKNYFASKNTSKTV